MTFEQREMLYAKFDADVRNKSRLLRIAIAFDQLCGTIFWNTSQDETISSQIGRRKVKGTATKWDLFICKWLSKLENNHCTVSMGE